MVKAHPRGAAIVETALCLGVAFALLYGTMQLGMIGYQQISADGAAYVSQHVGDQGADGYKTATAVYRQIDQGELDWSPHPSQTPSGKTVDYGYANTTNRHGGAAVTGAVSVETVVNHQVGFTLPFAHAFLGVSLQGDAVSQFQDEEGPGWNLAGATTPSTKLDNASPWWTTNDFSAPYFLARNYLIRCVNPYPWTSCATTTEYAYSSAEYLDRDNAWRPTPGVQPAPDATFYEIPCHQRVLAQWAAKLPDALPNAKSANRTALVRLFNPASAPAPDPDMATIRSWEVSQSVVYGANAAPLTPASGC